MNLYQRRRLTNLLSLSLSALATGIALLFLFWILWTLLRNGLPYLEMSTFTQSTPPPGSQGGLANAIVGSLILTGGGILIGAPIGILAGTYLSEFGRNSRLATLLRFVNDVLLSAPSIVIGVFVYELLVRTTIGITINASATAPAYAEKCPIVRTRTS